jgi:hypothetical protein
MSISRHGWRSRHKRWTRRLANDLRNLAPLTGLVFCFAGSATAIYASQHVPALLAAAAAQPFQLEQPHGLAPAGACSPRSGVREASEDARNHRG